jgi:proteasome activator subunit 4
MRGNYHQTRVQELVQRFSGWRAERLPGSRAFQSTYDKLVLCLNSLGLLLIIVSRVGTTVCRWLFQTVHDTNAISAFDYILPLMVRKSAYMSFLTLMLFLRSLNYFDSPKVLCTVSSMAWFHFFSSSVNDNDELLSRARMLLVRMCGVTPPRPLIGPILNAIFDTILNSPVRRSPADL